MSKSSYGTARSEPDLSGSHYSPQLSAEISPSIQPLGVDTRRLLTPQVNVGATMGVDR